MSYTHVRNRLLAMTITIIAICTMAFLGIAQMGKVARFHELNSLHLQAAQQLRSLLERAAPALPERAALRDALRFVRDQPQACLDEIGWLENAEIRLLGAATLITLCRDDVAHADRVLALVAAAPAGALAAPALAAQLRQATRQFEARSNAFIAPVTLVGKRIERIVLVGMVGIALIAIVFALGIAGRINTSVVDLHHANEALAASELRNRQLALYDNLTGLPNRNLFIDRLDQAIVATMRAKGALAVLFVDLDRFKNVNDSLGHSAGDELLKVIADRLLSVVRGTDTVARMGGDEFAIILGQVAQRSDPVLVAERIIAVVGERVVIDGIENHVTASIGITFCPQDGSDSLNLLKNADLAMYEAKAGGRNSYRFYSPQTDEHTRLRVRDEHFLRDAVTADQLRLHYHPVVDLHSGATIGAEALLRWVHPINDLAMPASFIALAEDTGLIGEIGLWVLDNALAQCRQWRHAAPDFAMAVNVSVRQMRDPALADKIGALLHRHQIAPAALQLEITESLFLAGDDVALETLGKLGELGVVLSIDDFGTGYSSFGYLRELPFRLLKIDRSFIRNLPDGRDARAVVAAILSMAQALDLAVVAEGVENARQREFLRAMGCRLGQGYLFGLPVPAAAFEPTAMYPV